MASVRFRKANNGVEMCDATAILDEDDFARAVARDHGLTVVELRAMARAEIRDTRTRKELARRAAAPVTAPAMPVAVDPIRARVLRITAGAR